MYDLENLYTCLKQISICFVLGDPPRDRLKSVSFILSRHHHARWCTRRMAQNRLKSVRRLKQISILGLGKSLLVGLGKSLLVGTCPSFDSTLDNFWPVSWPTNCTKISGLSGSFDAKFSAFVIKFSQEKLGDMSNNHIMIINLLRPILQKNSHSRGESQLTIAFVTQNRYFLQLTLLKLDNN